MTLPKLIKLVLPHTVVATLLLAPFAIQAADTASGELNTSSPTYDRIFTGSVDPNCNATSSFSGTGVGVYYQVFPFYSTSGEAADVEITNSTVSDTTISIYCDFDPTDASLSLVAYDDDGGVGLLSAITPAEAAILAPNTTYYLVVSTFSPGDTGTFDVILGGDLLFGNASAATPVPVMNIWGLFALISLMMAVTGNQMRKGYRRGKSAG